MKGLYILTNPVLNDQKTIKIGMSLRIHERVYDYDAVFTENKYLYCFITKKSSKTEILKLESLVLEKTKELRNFKFSTEYRKLTDFTLKNYYDLIVNCLKENNVQYEILENPVFEKKVNYNRETLDRTDELKNIFKFRYGQEIAYNNFRDKLRLDSYWGLMIAPTGWGKSMMHYIFMGLFLEKCNKNIFLITKRKDILEDVINEIQDQINYLRSHNKFPEKEIKIIDQVNNKFDIREINKFNQNTIIIINSDKLITRDQNNKTFDSKKLDDIVWSNFGLVLFDEVHWSGSRRNVQFMKYLKDNISHGIGSSATPIRKSLQNQENIKKLYGENYDILYELSYTKAWEEKVILKVDTIMFPIIEEKQNSINTDSDIFKPSMTKIILEIQKYIRKSYKKKIIIYFRNRLSLLHWFDFMIENKCFPDFTFFMSFTYNICSEDTEDTTIDQKVYKEIQRLDIDPRNIDSGITNFKKEANHAILLVVGRANEGFNDPFVDICVNLDFYKNNSILLTLQKMGRCQRIHQDKKKGYYICPIISKNTEEFKDILAQTVYNYIKTTEDHSINRRDIKTVSKELLREIIETFRVEGIVDFTNDDIMKRIRRLEKESKLTLEQFVENLKTYDIKDHKQYNKVWESNDQFKDLGMPEFYDNIIGFAWNLVNDDNYHKENEIVKVLRRIYKKDMCLFDELDNHNDILDILCKKDPRIPSEFPWCFYNIDKSSFLFIYN